MLRVPTDPRVDWPRIVESQGLLFHSIDGMPYWDETAYYLFEAKEVDAIETATARLDALCLEAVGHVIGERRLDEFDIPPPSTASSSRAGSATSTPSTAGSTWRSTARGRPSSSSTTPTRRPRSWRPRSSSGSGSRTSWLAGRPETRDFDQFNSIHERLIEAWGRVGRELGPRVTFAAIEESLEDVMTITYLRDTAIQAGLETQPIPSRGSAGTPAVGPSPTSASGRSRSSSSSTPGSGCSASRSAGTLPIAPTRWLEPPWKMVLSNKAILVVLWELFPESPYLLRAEFRADRRRPTSPSRSIRGKGRTSRSSRRGRPSPRPAATTARAGGSTRNTSRSPISATDSPSWGAGWSTATPAGSGSARMTGGSPGTRAGSCRTSSASRPTPSRRPWGRGGLGRPGGPSPGRPALGPVGRPLRRASMVPRRRQSRFRRPSGPRRSVRGTTGSRPGPPVPRRSRRFEEARHPLEFLAVVLAVVVALMEQELDAGEGGVAGLDEGGIVVVAFGIEAAGRGRRRRCRPSRSRCGRRVDSRDPWVLSSPDAGGWVESMNHVRSPAAPGSSEIRFRPGAPDRLSRRRGPPRSLGSTEAEPRASGRIPATGPVETTQIDRLLQADLETGFSRNAVNPPARQVSAMSD